MPKYKRVYIEITNICNMNCSFCHGHSREYRSMSIDEFSLILKKLKGVTEYIYFHLMGEPLTHDELPLFLSMAKNEGFKPMITTNGTLLKQVGQSIIEQKPHKVNISVHSFEDGSEEQYNEYINQIASFANQASQNGIITVLRLWNNGFDGGLNNKTLESLKELLPGEWAENSKGMRIKEKLFLEWGDRFEWPDINKETKGDEYFCYGLRDHFGILCDGTIVPCCLDSDGVINLGNVYTDDLSTILESERAKRIVEYFSCRKASEELCKKCGYAQRFIKNKRCNSLN